MTVVPRGRPLRAAGVVVGLWLPYTALNLIFPGPPLTYVLGLLLAGLALAALLATGAGRTELGLRLGRPSLPGAGALGLVALVIPLALAEGRAQPWHPVDDLVYAPLSAVGQELYFRAAVLAALQRLGQGRRRVVVLQAVLFALWHARALRVVPLGLAVLVVVGAGVGGLVWGWQVQRDRTVLYALLEHAVFLGVL